MSADQTGEDKHDFPKFGEVVGELSAAMLRHLSSGNESARVLKKHWLLAQAELLKGYQEVIRMELEQAESPKPSKKTKIVVE
jgi:hypothetical protein